jgi:hypothetical protein
MCENDYICSLNILALHKKLTNNLLILLTLKHQS